MFTLLTLQLPIQTPNCVAPELQVEFIELSETWKTTRLIACKTHSIFRILKSLKRQRQRKEPN